MPRNPSTERDPPIYVTLKLTASLRLALIDAQPPTRRVPPEIAKLQTPPAGACCYRRLAQLTQINAESQMAPSAFIRGVAAACCYRQDLSCCLLG